MFNAIDIIIGTIIRAVHVVTVSLRAHQSFRHLPIRTKQ